MKIQTKTAVFFTGLTAGILFLMSLVVYWLVTHFTFQDFKKRLQLRAVIAAKINLEQDETSTRSFDELRRRHLEVLPEQKEYILKINEASGKVQSYPNLHLPDHFYKAVLKNGEAFFDKGPTNYAGIYYPDNQGNFIVVASAENDYGTQELKNLRTIFLVCMIGGMGIAFSVGLFFSKKTFEPVRSIVAKMKSITAQNLHLRLPERVGKDEISELAHTFNNMLDRLETAFETQNNFISHASHELSTPLTTIIGEAELALARRRTPEAYTEALQIILQESERLHQLTAGLLALAQSSFNTRQQLKEKILIDELLLDVKMTTEKIESQCQVKIDLSQLPADESLLQITGNRQLLTLALSNIVMNACKYSGNKPVIIRLTFQNKGVQVKVSDSGIGIPEKDMPHILEPFFRASNAVPFKGHGIGLPLTAAILRQHSATLHIHSKEGIGTDVEIHFPAA